MLLRELHYFDSVDRFVIEELLRDCTTQSTSAGLWTSSDHGDRRADGLNVWSPQWAPRWVVISVASCFNLVSCLRLAGVAPGIQSTPSGTGKVHRD